MEMQQVGDSGNDHAGTASSRKGKLNNFAGAKCSNQRPLLTDRAWIVLSGSLSLTDREVQVIRGVLLNLKDAAIGSLLGISPHTVHVHLNHVFTKLKVTTRAELIRRIYDELHALILQKGELPPICHLRANGRCPAERAKTQGR